MSQIAPVIRGGGCEGKGALYLIPVIPGFLPGRPTPGLLDARRRDVPARLAPRPHATPARAPRRETQRMRWLPTNDMAGRPTHSAKLAPDSL
jgi:hypothetical protein